MGIEPTYPAWKAGVLPLNYTRRYSVERAIDGARTRGLDLGKVARYQLRHYRISGWWESNPRIQLGRLVFYHWTTPAQLVVCVSLSHQRRLVYMMKLYLSTLNLNFFYFFDNIVTVHFVLSNAAKIPYCLRQWNFGLYTPRFWHIHAITYWIIPTSSMLWHLSVR